MKTFANSHQIAILLTMAFLVGISGCGDPNRPKLSTVSGRVTLDGEVVKEGTISLLPVDGQGGSYGARIMDGKYQLQASPGAKTVKISCPLLIPSPTGEKEDTVVMDVVPAEYNNNTTLKMSVQDSGPTEANFDLKGKLSPPAKASAGR